LVQNRPCEVALFRPRPSRQWPSSQYNSLIARAVPDQPSAVFLDRDGTLNVKADEGSYVTSARQLRLIAGSGMAVRRLNEASVPVIVVTNQRGVALGKMSLEDVYAVNDEVQRRLRRCGGRVDAFYVCPHQKGTCTCRKPSPGLLLQAGRDFPEVRLDRAVMIGDSESDVDAGLAASACAIRLGRAGTPTRAAAVFPDLLSAVKALLGRTWLPARESHDAAQASLHRPWRR
jgi:D-glycero-D-manno-heptose 1,7-bisphosphate phosphatase